MKRICMATGQYPRPDTRIFYFQPSGVAGCHGLAMSVVMIHCQRSYYKEQWILGVADEDCVNRGRTTSKNGQANRCRHCCASWMTEADGQSSSPFPQRLTCFTTLPGFLVAGCDRSRVAISPGILRCWVSRSALQLPHFSLDPFRGSLHFVLCLPSSMGFVPRSCSGQRSTRSSRPENVRNADRNSSDGRRHTTGQKVIIRSTSLLDHFVKQQVLVIWPLSPVTRPI